MFVTVIICIIIVLQKYIKSEPTERTIDTVSVIRISQGSEPRVFKRMFPVWEESFWQVSYSKFISNVMYIF